MSSSGHVRPLPGTCTISNSESCQKQPLERRVPSLTAVAKERDGRLIIHLFVLACIFQYLRWQGTAKLWVSDFYFC